MLALLLGAAFTVGACQWCIVNVSLGILLAASVVPAWME